MTPYVITAASILFAGFGGYLIGRARTKSEIEQIGQAVVGLQLSLKESAK